MTRFASFIVAALFCGTAAGQLMPPAKERELRALMPAVDDTELQRAFDRALIYTEAEIPPAYQRNGRFVRVARESTDGNFRFPWSDPVGMQRVEGDETFRFVILPEGKPVVYSKGKLDSRDQSANSTVWTYPLGTRIGEVLLQKGPDGKRYPFLLRLLTREPDDWDGEQFVPFPTARSLADGIAQARPNWQSDRQLSAAVASLLAAEPFPSAVIEDKNAVRLIRNSVGVYNLPKLDPTLVAELLTGSTFEPLSGAYFKYNGNAPSAALPSNEKGSFNIVPPNFRGALAGNTRESCKRCHGTVGQLQVRFDNTWTAHLRGSDRIFSFRPGTTDPRTGKFVPRPELLRAGLIAERDPAIHPTSVYSPLPN